MSCMARSILPPGITSVFARLMKEYEDKKRREAGAEAEFAKLMQAGEAAMGAADYKKAVDSFTAALGIKAGDPVEQIMALTDGRGVDVAI